MPVAAVSQARLVEIRSTLQSLIDRHYEAAAKHCVRVPDCDLVRAIAVYSWGVYLTHTERSWPYQKFIIRLWEEILNDQELLKLSLLRQAFVQEGLKVYIGISVINC